MDNTELIRKNLFNIRHDPPPPKTLTMDQLFSTERKNRRIKDNEATTYLLGPLLMYFDGDKDIRRLITKRLSQRSETIDMVLLCNLLYLFTWQERRGNENIRLKLQQIDSFNLSLPFDWLIWVLFEILFPLEYRSCAGNSTSSNQLDCEVITNGNGLEESDYHNLEFYFYLCAQERQEKVRLFDVIEKNCCWRLLLPLGRHHYAIAKRIDANIEPTYYAVENLWYPRYEIAAAVSAYVKELWNILIDEFFTYKTAREVVESMGYKGVSSEDMYALGKRVCKELRIDHKKWIHNRCKTFNFKTNRKENLYSPKEQETIIELAKEYINCATTQLVACEDAAIAEDPTSQTAAKKLKVVK